MPYFRCLLWPPASSGCSSVKPLPGVLSRWNTKGRCGSEGAFLNKLGRVLFREDLESLPSLPCRHGVGEVGKGELVWGGLASSVGGILLEAAAASFAAGSAWRATMAAAVAAGVPNAVAVERSMAGGLRLGSGPRPRAADLPAERQSVVAAIRQSRFRQDIQILTHPLGEGQQEDLEIAVCRLFYWGFPLQTR